MAIQKVVLIGAGGNLGPHILQGLLDAKFDVTIVARKSSTSKFPSGVKVVSVGDEYPYSEVVSVFKGQDAVISTIAGMATTVQKTLIDAAVEAGVQRFIPAEFGSEVNEAEAEKNPIFLPKLEIRRYLQSKESAGLTWTGVANNAFFEWGLEVGFLHFDIKNRKADIWEDGAFKFRTSTWHTIGTATAGALKNPEATKNRMIHVQTFQVSQNELLAELEKATGSKWEVQKIDGKKFTEENEKKVAQGDIGAGYNLIWAHIVGGGDYPEGTVLDNDALGVQKEDLSGVISRVVKGQS